MNFFILEMSVGIARGYVPHPQCHNSPSLQTSFFNKTQLQWGKLGVRRESKV